MYAVYAVASLLIRVPLLLSLPLAAVGILGPTAYLLALTAYLDDRTK